MQDCTAQAPCYRQLALGKLPRALSSVALLPPCFALAEPLAMYTLSYPLLFGGAAP